MSADPFEQVPDALRETARRAISSAAGPAQVTGLSPVTGGGSGALAYRVDLAARAFLLRLESGSNARQNPDQYACMQAASHAGIAPPLRFADPARGAAVMDFVAQRPLAEYPGGPLALVRDLGLLIRRLQDTTDFPMPPITYADVTRRMLTFVQGSKIFAPGLLTPHLEGFDRIAAAYPWDHAGRVSSHNDPNPRNVLFDGRRLWLCDWETACRNDPLTDPAVVTHELAATPEQQELLLRSWLGRAPDRATRARLLLMRQVTRMFFACALLRFFAGDPNRQADPDLNALTPAEFVAAIQQGTLRLGSPQVLYEFGKMFLAGFRAELDTPAFEDALRAAREA